MTRCSIAALFALALAASACQVRAQPIAVARAQMSASVSAAIGRSAVINGMRIVPMAIVEDSRCPANARCIWAGRLVVLTEIDAPGSGEKLSLKLEPGTPVIVHGGRLTLARADPVKTTGRALAPSDYRFVYRFEKS